MTALTLMLDLMQATTGRITLAKQGAAMFTAQGCLGTHHIGVQLCSRSATSMGVPKKSLTHLCV